MSAQNNDRNELIAMLALQLDMGIDEALLDHPQVDAAPLRLDQLLAGAAPAGDKGVSQIAMGSAALQPSEVLKMANPALANSGAVPPRTRSIPIARRLLASPALSICNQLWPSLMIAH